VTEPAPAPQTRDAGPKGGRHAPWIAPLAPPLSSFSCPSACSSSLAATGGGAMRAGRRTAHSTSGEAQNANFRAGMSRGGGFSRGAPEQSGPTRRDGEICVAGRGARVRDPVIAARRRRSHPPAPAPPTPRAAARWRRIRGAPSSPCCPEPAGLRWPARGCHADHFLPASRPLRPFLPARLTAAPTLPSCPPHGRSDPSVGRGRPHAPCAGAGRQTG